MNSFAGLEKLLLVLLGGAGAVGATAIGGADVGSVLLLVLLLVLLRMLGGIYNLLLIDDLLYDTQDRFVRYVCLLTSKCIIDFLSYFFLV